MAVMGFVEYVSRQQIRGWVADEQRPDLHIDIAVRVGSAQIASGKAALYRYDLQEAGVGEGDHGFVINLNPMLPEAALPDLVVGATGVPGGWLPLEMLPHAPEPGAVANPRRKPAIDAGAEVQDPTQYPVFVLGAARSGTSAVAQALLKTGYYAGHEEGHVLALMAQQMKTIQDYYDANGEETLASRDTTLARIPKEYFMRAIANNFKDLIPNLWKNKHWVDKTPNGKMISASPLFLHLWPNAKFIFMKRRPLENIASRMRKFPQLSFETHCIDWASVMTAWTATKYELGASAIEVEQFELAVRPEQTAARLIAFLQLPPSAAGVFRQTLLVERPERTSQTFADPLTFKQVDWTDGQRSVFQKICGPLLLEYGYATDGRYYADRTVDGSRVMQGSTVHRVQ